MKRLAHRYNALEGTRKGTAMTYSAHRPKGFQGQGDSHLP